MKKQGTRICTAEPYLIAELKTDEKRFQNRKNAFSELSAEAVERNYDPNKFDPIVIWEDPKNQQLYVLSGHSRFEGMKRRKEKTIPARLFKGTEAEAIQFAKVDANRAANVETIAEDIAAYQLMRDGDSRRAIKPAAKKEIHRVFKGKVAKLEAYSHLDPKGLFIQTLKEEDRSLYPFIEQKSLWAGELRNEFPHLTNIHERDLFNFLYSDKQNLTLNKDDFRKTVEARIRLGKERLFPECDDRGCEKIKSVDQLLKTRRERELFRELEAIERDIEAISDRLRTNKIAFRVYTEVEKDALRTIASSLKEDRTRLRKELNLAEKAGEGPALFGKLNSMKMKKKRTPRTPEQQYNALHGRTVAQCTLLKLRERFAKDTDEWKRLTNAIQTAELMPGKKVFVQVTKRSGVTTSPQRRLFNRPGLGVPVSAQDLARMEFDTINFTAQWKELMGCPPVGFWALVFGDEKSGKSCFCTKFSDYLSRFGPTLYVAAEEGLNQTLKQRVAMFTKQSRNLYFLERPGLNELIQQIKARKYRFVVLDSLTELGWDIAEIQALQRSCPGVSWITVVQMTKTGDYRGSKSLGHGCTMKILLEDGVAYQNGRTTSPSSMKVFG